MCPVRAAIPVNALAMSFPPDPVWVRSAREAVRTAMSTVALVEQERVDTAMLLTSEAVTNAVLASRNSVTPAPIGFRAAWTGDGALHVLVEDLAPGLPALPAAPGDGDGAPERGDRVCRPTLDEEHGRGMLLITREATDWGVCTHEAAGGKSVWFRLG